ncbi:DUF4910 domain-containing protein [Fusibacter sp. 3D3]|uniref:DUF4910 domain-containing protein n=1 Tax=Fusibacter sp. 3D3 TaxID=1048380 RepID=UPI000852AFFF|nr:DUF4910 domain-containing protein [Fusibacter sp. 3D3]GAU77770.1 hypothetical protein F3D3_2399 [Fusibacter sp. 3D3]
MGHSDLGNELYDFAVELFPINRSITGEGVRETLLRIKKRIPIEIKSVHTGTQVFDWTVPKEWNVREAYIEDSNGNRVVDFKNNNLHLVGYSIPMDKIVNHGVFGKIELSKTAIKNDKK